MEGLRESGLRATGRREEEQLGLSEVPEVLVPSLLNTATL